MKKNMALRNVEVRLEARFASLDAAIRSKTHFTTKRIELPNLQDLKLTVGGIVMEHPELRFLIIWKSSDPLRYELQTEEDRYTEIQDYSSFDDLHRSSQEKLERATVTATAVGSLEPPE
uniref:Uncharacterized protein n=1 Tax=Timema douglasi TaxID=61478 RepID=A0A7R8Z4Z9_TIMDO|nr:unnamed protein product [Timema douglasi]